MTNAINQPNNAFFITLFAVPTFIIEIVTYKPPKSVLD